MRTDTGRDELLIPQKGLVLVKKFGDVEDLRVGDGVHIGPGKGKGKGVEGGRDCFLLDVLRRFGIFLIHFIIFLMS